MLVQAISANKLTQASKIAFEIQMERALLSKKYWDELLEKLRKSGGGGGGPDKRFDQIAVSMMLTNFLRNKMIQAMIKNLNQEFLGLTHKIPTKLQWLNQNIFVSSVQKFGKAIFNKFVNVFSLIMSRDTVNRVSKTITDQFPLLIGVISFQLNKLKDIIDEHFRETIIKLDLKERLKKLNSMISDFFVEAREEVFSIVNLVTNYVKKYLLPSISTGIPRITQ